MKRKDVPMTWSLTGYSDIRLLVQSHRGRDSIMLSIMHLL